MDRCEEFKNKIDELVREFKDLTGEEIHEIFKELADGTLTYVYQLRTSKDICYNTEEKEEMKANELMIGDRLKYNKEITDWGKIHHYKSPEDTFRFAIYEYNDEPGVIYLSNVFVSLENRHLGFGNTILKLVDKIAKNKRAYVIFLKVKKDSFAYNWYNRHGYEKFGVDKEDNTMIWMKKEI